MILHRSAAANVSAVLLAIAGGTIIGLAFVCLAVPIRWDDQSFYIYAAPHLLDGYHLYGADITDTNPPLISWMTMVPAMVARALDLTPDLSFTFFILLLICAVALWSVRLSVNDLVRARATFILGLIILLMYIAVVLPNVTNFNALRYDFGQREHILALLVLPYLFLAAQRLRARGCSHFEAILVGVTAGIGFSIKPQYLTVLASVELLLVFSARRLRTLIRPELLALACTGLVYFACVWIITPDYVTRVVPIVAGVYGSFDYVPALAMLNHVTVYVLAFFALTLIRRSGFSDLATTFLVASIGAFLAYLMQHKGWTDHILPTQMFLVLSVGISAIGRSIQWTPRQPPTVRPVLLALAAILSCLTAIGIYYPTRESLWAQSDRAKQIAEFNNATADFPPGTSFVALSEGIDFQFDVASDRGFVWASRYPFIMLSENTVRSSAEPEPARDETARRNSSSYLMIADILRMLGDGAANDSANDYSRNLRSNIIADFRRWRPKIVLAQRCSAVPGANCGSWNGFDVLRWLAIDPSFASLWSDYRLVQSIGGHYDLYIEDH
jgi:hypothetical protein